MDVKVFETTLSMAILQVPDGLEGEELQKAVEQAKDRHDMKGGGYSWMETVTWTWDAEPKVTDCKHPEWTEESSSNGWRSQCVKCGVFAQGSCQG